MQRSLFKKIVVRVSPNVREMQSLTQHYAGQIKINGNQQGCRRVDVLVVNHVNGFSIGQPAE